MEKIIDTETIQYTKYDKDCPFDAAMSIFDWYDRVWRTDIKGIVFRIWSDKCLNKRGKRLLTAMDAIECGRVSKFSLTEEEYEFECKEYEKWKAKNIAIPVPKKLIK